MAGSEDRVPYVAITGTPGGGASTALGLLYCTMLADAARPDPPYRFHADPAALDVVSRVYESIASGAFPPHDAPDTAPSFLCRLSRSDPGAAVGLFRRRPPAESAHPLVDLLWMPLSAAELGALAAPGALLGPRVQRLAAADALVVVVPIPPKPSADAA